MLKVKKISMKNFLSIGNVEQIVQLDDTGLTLILGENIDLGSTGNRNGVGKSSLIQAISFGLFGNPLTNIKKDNLINKINQKNMEVSIEFEVGNRNYKIERGRKPNYIRYFVNDGLVNSPDTDEGHGESKWTQREIDKVLGFSHTLFKHIVALHTKTIPFLSLGVGQQSAIIEELLGITQLSQKAEQLKEQNKQVKDEIKSEEIRIKTVLDSNEKIQKTINEIKLKSKIWERDHDQKIEKIRQSIIKNQEVDVELEINSHRVLTSWLKINQEFNQYSSDLSKIERIMINYENNLYEILEQIKLTENHSCHTCGQMLHDEKHQEIIKDLTSKKINLENEIETLGKEYLTLTEIVTVLSEDLDKLGDKPKTVYSNIEDALNHRHLLDKLNTDIKREEKLENPFIDQIATLETSGIQPISYDYLNELVSLKEHQEFLLKLLTSKDSFIRKKIIDQNLSYLNHRLNYYLEKLLLPHEVVFQSDLSVSITNLGREYDFEQLSNGESNRLVLSLAWSFRDVWETMNQPFNLLMIDELVDSGLDEAGTDSSLMIIKEMARTGRKNIFLISHKNNLETRVDKILLVQKENGFTNFCEPTTEW